MNLFSPTTWTRATFIGAGVLALVAVFVLVWFAGSRYGKRRTAAVDEKKRTATKDRILFTAALLAGLAVYGSYVVGSYQGLTGFGRDFVGWQDWRQVIVPVALDGSAVTFSFQAFRYVLQGRSPMLCYLVVLLSASASATFNFVEGGNDHVWQGGVFLAFLSLAGMAMAHVFLDQFRKAAKLGKYIRFGIRWLTSPHSTACAALAWVNFPPEQDEKIFPPTARNGLVHLEAVRASKRAAADAQRVRRAVSGGWTLRPWARAAALAADLAASRTAEQDTTGALRKLTEEFAGFRSERDAERSAERARLAAAEQETERLRAELAEQSEQDAIVRAERALEHRAEQSAEHPSDGIRSQRSTAGRSGRSTTPERRPGAPKMTDAEALRVMLREHKEPDYEWGSREVNRLTGAGFGRIPKLIEMVAEHHAARVAEQSSERAHRTDRSTSSDDSEERAV